MTDQWTHNIKKFTKFTEDKASFIFEQSQICLTHSLDNKVLLEQRALLIVGALITLSTGALGFFVTQYKFDIHLSSQNWTLLLPLLVIEVFFYLAIFNLVKKVLAPEKYFPLGNEPMCMLEQKYVNQAKKFILFSEANNTQVRLEHNINLNILRAKAIEESLFVSVSAPVVGAGLMVLSELLRSS